MKIIIRLGYIAFLFVVLFAASATASNLDDAVKWWLKSHQSLSKSIGHQAQVGLRSTSDKKLRLDSILMKSPDTATMVMTIPQKIVFLYDASGMHMTQLRHERDDVSFPWSLEDSTLFTYDTQGHMIIDTLFTRIRNTDKWYQREINENRFDARGRLLMESNKYRYNENNPWEGGSQKKYQFDANGKLVGQLLYTLTDEDVWALSKKRLSLSDGTRDTAWYVYTYSPLDSTWSLEAKELCLYDSSDHFNMRTIRQWDTDSLCWTIRRKIDYNYDVWENKISEYSYDLDMSTQEWIQDAGEDWSYDERGNLLTNTSKLGKDYWFLGGITMKTEYLYDYSVESSDVFTFLNPAEFPAYNLMTGCTIYFYMPALDTWYETANMTCYYTDLNVAITHTPKQNHTSWYYDSASKCLSFDKSLAPSTVNMFEMQGRQVKTSTTIKNSQLSLRDLPKGIYVIQMTLEGRVMQDKVVVE